jgi:hypothetical protein
VIPLQDQECGDLILTRAKSSIYSTKPSNTKTIAAGANSLNYLVGLVKTDEELPAGGAISLPINYTLSYQ